MKIARQIMQILLVLTIALFLVRAEPTPRSAEPSRLPLDSVDDVPPRKPSPEEIVSWAFCVAHFR
jgi:hypothetical protein